MSEHPAKDIHNWRAYERNLIPIGGHAAIMVTLWQRVDYMQDLWMNDSPDIQRQHHEIYESAAKQFCSQLEGHDCIAFWQALRDEANRHIQEWEWAKNGK